MGSPEARLRPGGTRVAAMWVLWVGAGACGNPPPGAGPCASLDPVLGESAFVLVTSPMAGQVVSSPVRVQGCSRSFESTIVWALRGRDGRTLASGHASGGGVDGPAAFEFLLEFAVAAPEVGELEVLEPDASDGEGYPSSRTIFPIVLRPSGRAPAEGVPLALLGDFLDDYDIEYSITPESWSQGAMSRYHIVEWDGARQSLLTRNADSNPSDGGRWTRVDWVVLEPGGGEYAWAFCYAVYDAPTADAARAAPATGRDTPRTGCNGFPFSRMKPAG